MGQSIDSIGRYDWDIQLKHWWPLQEGIEDSMIYVVDFNYLLNGLQVSATNR